MLVTNHEKLFEEIELLPIDIKTKLIDRLLKSITPTSEKIDKLWINEANRRKKEIEEDKISLIDGNRVFEDIAKRLNS